MDENTLPSDLAARPRSQEGGVPVPFACEHEDGGFGLREVSKRRAIRCALSRICGLCGISLGWPVAFLGSPEEVDDNALHFPPVHEACADAALSLYPALGAGVLAIDGPPDAWVLLTTGGAQSYHEVGYRPGDVLLGGRESAGVPDEVHASAELRVRVPMVAGRRALNLVTALAIVLGEALRQTGGFPS